tara:strand:+ start:6819 stop:6995 length:177 start_codon:yes stop_codon:yes gene_type:complete
MKEQEKMPITNAERMEALVQQKTQLENSFQRISGAIELLQAIIESDKIQGKKNGKNKK